MWDGVGGNIAVGGEAINIINNMCQSVRSHRAKISQVSRGDREKEQGTQINKYLQLQIYSF